MTDRSIVLNSVNETGTVVSIRDNSVWDSAGEPQISDVQELIVTVSNYSSDVLNTGDITDPVEIEDKLLRSDEIDITSVLVGATTPEQGLVPFSDGILDVNVYYVLSEELLATVTTGNTYIQIDGDYTDYDAVFVNGKLYDIDKSKPTNQNTVLYVTEPFEDDSATFQLVYRANLKVLVDAKYNYNLTSIIGQQSQRCIRKDKVRECLVDMKIDLESARYFYEKGVYEKANDLVISASLRSSKCGCGC